RAALDKFDKSHKIQASSMEADKLYQIKNLFGKEYKHRFMVKVGNQFNTFNVEEIAYFKSEDGIIFFYTFSGNKYPIEYSIEQLVHILNPIQFFRVNRKYMVSVKAVMEIHSYFNSRLLLKLK